MLSEARQTRREKGRLLSGSTGAAFPEGRVQGQKGEGGAGGGEGRRGLSRCFGTAVQLCMRTGSWGWWWRRLHSTSPLLATAADLDT